MSEVLSSYRSGRGPTDRTDPAYNIGTLVKLEPIPRTYTSGGNAGGLVTKGAYVYPKAGLQVFFYSDSSGSSRIGASRNQTNAPMRTGDEFVGTATGIAQTGPNGTFIQVDWVNSYVNHNLLKADERIDEPKTGWVDASKVIWQEAAKSPGDDDTVNIDTTPIAGGNSGIDTTTLGYGAVAAALIFGLNKKKKRR
jgi:hypothetical protein